MGGVASLGVVIDVFADLGFDNPKEERFKAKLVRELRGIIKRRKLTETRAAVVLGLKPPDVSALVTGRVGKFSIDRLVRCLDRLDYKVDLVVRHKPRRFAAGRRVSSTVLRQRYRETDFTMVRPSKNHPRISRRCPRSSLPPDIWTGLFKA